jgi:CubicO group peptidase (beta-lactamase class C family)
MKVRFACAVIFFLASLLSSCRVSRYPTEYRYSIPSDLSDGLAAKSLLETKSDMSLLSRGFSRIFAGEAGEIHSVLAAKGAELFLEEYFPGKAFKGSYTEFSPATPQSLASVTKSITSLLVGIAVEKGFIESIDDGILKYFPEYDDEDREQKGRITLRDLLTMTAGFTWDEHSASYLSLRNDIVRFYISGDPIAYILSKKMVAEPGTAFNYCGGCTNLLAEIIRRASGLPIDQFSERYLFSPMDIEGAKWVRLRSGFVYASGDLQLKARDLLKIGCMLVDAGVWKGKRIISEDWISQSMSMSYPFKDDGTSGYGFQWWIDQFPTKKGARSVISARGWGDQFLLMVPADRLVIVTTGANYKKARNILGIVSDDIYPALDFEKAGVGNQLTK